MGVSLKPSDAVEGGGLLDDVDVKISEAKFAMFDYMGKAQPVPALLLRLDSLDGSDLINQYWSMGKPLDWMPSDDGKELVPIGKATELVLSSNGMILLASAVNAGFPESKLGDDISILAGTECHVNRVAAPKRTGMVSSKENQTILTITKIHKLPWDAAAEKPKGAKSTSTATTAKPRTRTTKAAAKTTTAKTEAPTVSIDDIATEFILGVLADDDTMKDYPDGIPKAKLAPCAFAKFPADDPNRSATVKKVFDDEFLNAGPWNYASGKISM